MFVPMSAMRNSVTMVIGAVGLDSRSEGIASDEISTDRARRDPGIVDCQSVVAVARECWSVSPPLPPSVCH